MVGEMRFEYEHKNAMDFGSYGLGATINPMENQLQGTNLGMNWGLRSLEIGFAGSRWQGAPIGKLGKPEREEIIRLAKLNKVNLTLHAPIKDAAGFNGRVFDESARMEAVDDFKKTLEFADQIGRETGIKHVPVVVHCADGTPGNPDPEHIVYLADRETKQVAPLMYSETEVYPKDVLVKDFKFPPELLKDRRYVEPVKGKPDQFVLKPLGKLFLQNAQDLFELESNIGNIDYNIHFYRDHIMSMQRRAAMEGRELTKEEKETIRRYLAHVRAYEAQKKLLENRLERYKERYGEDPRKYKRYVTTDEVAKEQVAKTAAELAWYSFSKLKSQPAVAVENIFPTMALGNPEKLAETIEEARKRFVEVARKRGIGEKQAKAAAEKLIGMNFDIGHANMWKRYKIWDDAEQRFRPVTDEDIKRWAEKVTPYVKYVHLSDNWGDEDSHLPIGWGNAPTKEVVDIFKKKGFKGRIIAETAGGPGAMVSGIPETLKYFRAQLTPTTTWDMANRTYFESGYPFMVGPIYPEVGVNLYGTGFSGLPYATGAQIGGGEKRSRFSGAPNA